MSDQLSVEEVNKVISTAKSSESAESVAEAVGSRKEEEKKSQSSAHTHTDDTDSLLLISSSRSGTRSTLDTEHETSDEESDEEQEGVPARGFARAPRRARPAVLARQAVDAAHFVRHDERLGSQTDSSSSISMNDPWNENVMDPVNEVPQNGAMVARAVVPQVGAGDGYEEMLEGLFINVSDSSSRPTLSSTTESDVEVAPASEHSEKAEGQQQLSTIDEVSEPVTQSPASEVDVVMSSTSESLEKKLGNGMLSTIEERTEDISLESSKSAVFDKNDEKPSDNNNSSH